MLWASHALNGKIHSGNEVSFVIAKKKIRRLVKDCSLKPIRSQDYQFDTVSRYIGSCWANCPFHSWHHSFYWRKIKDLEAAKTCFSTNGRRQFLPSLENKLR